MASGVLRSEVVLKASDSEDPTAIQTLVLTHRALSEVSCLGEFKNLWKLDLRFNNLTCLQHLSLCSNLKWLSVAHNKLESLQGIQALPKLTVLNAGNNKLKSMDQVMSVTSLCALILNDNEISSICSLDQLSLLNTLVLSKNPITQIGNSLAMSKSITKLSLSSCRILSINASLKACTGLKELRLAHNGIRTLPAELAHIKNHQNLDLGYNVITMWSDVKVLNSLVNLKNLNLQGNPIAAKDKLVRKVKNSLPKLRVFNAKSIYPNHDKGSVADENPVTKDGNVGEAKDKKNVMKEKWRSSENPEDRVVLPFSKQKNKETKDMLQKRKGQFEENVMEKVKRREVDVIDDRDVSFTELLDVNKPVNLAEKVNTDKSTKGVVETHNPRRKKKAKVSSAQVSSVLEVGMGGPSSWGDD